MLNKYFKKKLLQIKEIQLNTLILYSNLIYLSTDHARLFSYKYLPSVTLVQLLQNLLLIFKMHFIIFIYINYFK